MMKRFFVLGAGVTGLALLLLSTPLGVAAQQTIRNITILAMPADSTELPAAAAAAENMSNPTAPFVLSANMCWDGTNWDRCPTSDGGNGAASANTSRTTEATDSQLSADIALIKTAVQLIDNDQIGSNPAAVVSAASTNSTSVATAPARLMSMHLINTTATIYYIRLYNLASAPTCSSGTGHVVPLPIPANTAAAGFSFNFGPTGLAFSTGIGYCITAGSAATDNTNAATGVFGILSWK
jgi:hypothetical protein